ncbi:hypothetical protein Dsin_001580 [Dipteronia sinensis]|uniref:Reverse transcriptase zinc-binding domain-containing protein n=1 Tax=Dipteronia sinensis TaxID=43782 RepID=A0AAE0B5W7_9ROSI|nr:hypothetical protein Dsin_001580 [Dipteronia sinensis]
MGFSARWVNLIMSLLFAKANDRNCLAVQKVLDTYVMAFGQVVNFDKSAMCVCPSISTAEGLRLAAMSKIEGWGEKLLSIGGKEILIKVVIQSIPVYAMNLFRLPKRLRGSVPDSGGDAMAKPENFTGSLGLAYAERKWRVAWFFAILSYITRTADTITWHYEGRGDYTVKSGYWLCHSVEAKSCPSSNTRLVKWWTRMWRLEIPLKVKVFVWKACHDWIPTMSSLIRMGIRTENRCLRFFFSFFGNDCGLVPFSIALEMAVVNWIKDDSHLESECGGIPADFSGLILGWNKVSINHISKEANRVARGLAKYALSQEEDAFWMEEFPPCGRTDVEADLVT